ncbi:MAG: PAS domain-containing protein, partial [Deltaproteobacteria bacterium]|nr:PAS domain-containing protein [Deltaproteobacteria bacterium]
MVKKKASLKSRKIPAKTLQEKIRELNRKNDRLRREVKAFGQKERQLEEMIRFEKLLSEISTHLVNLPAEQIEREIEQGLGRVVEFLGVDRGGVYIFSGDRTRISRKYFWGMEGIPESAPILEDQKFPWLSEKLRKGEILVIPRVDDLPEEAAQDREELKKYRNLSSLVIPLAVGKSVFGAVTFGAVRAERNWPEELIYRVRLVGEIFASALARKRSEDALRRAELEYRTVADFTYGWEYWANPDGTLRYVSPSCQRITGYPPGEFIDHPSLIREIILPIDRAAWDQHFRESRRGVQAHEIQFRIRKPDGQIRWIEHACQSVRGPQGEFLGYRVSNRDITERKRAEELLQRSQEELRRLSTRLLSVQEEERKRIARELHDGIGQSLSALKFLLENRLQMMEKNSAPGELQPLESMIPMLQNAIEEVRQMQTDLRPPTLDDLGIRATLSWFCREYQRIYSEIRIEQEIEVQENEIPH